MSTSVLQPLSCDERELMELRKQKKISDQFGSLGHVYPWGVSSLNIVVGTGKKKTGCRRRNVIKEDLVAEEDEVGKIW